MELNEVMQETGHQPAGGNENLENNYGLFSTILDNSHEIIVFALDSNYRYLAFNKLHRETMAGIWGKNIALGMSMLDVIGRHEDRVKAKACFDRALAGESFTVVEEYGDEALFRFFWQDSWSPIYTETGTIIGLSCFCLNVTDRYRTEAALRESEELYRSILNASPECIVITDLEGKIRMASPMAMPVLGYGMEAELKGHSILDFLIPEDQKRATDNISLMFQGVMTGPAEYLGKRKDGSVFHIGVNAEFIRNPEGDPAQMIFIARDITALKGIEQDLRESRQFLADVIENNGALIYAKDLVGRYVLVNRRWEETTGLKRMEAIGKSDMELFPEDVAKRFRAVDLEVIDQGRLVETEETLVEPSGKRYMISIKMPMRDQDDQIKGICGMSTEITERKRVEEALKISEEKYRLLTENTSDVIWVVNLDENKSIFFSPSVVNLTGYTADELVNQTLEELLSPEALMQIEKDVKEKAEHFRLYPQTVNRHMYESRERCKNGDLIWIETAITLRFNTVSQVEMVCVSRNVDERKKAEQQIAYLSYHDALTGLYNRRFYEEELHRIDTDRNLPITLVLADLNGLKLANDAFGHQVGDALIQRAAEVLVRECRQDEIIARVGGDEFVLLLPKTDSLEAEGIIQRIIASSAAQKVGSINLSIAFGWHTKYRADEDLNRVYKRAEDQMYRDKLSASPDTRNKTIAVIMSTLFEKYEEEEQHHARTVSNLCAAMGAALNLSPERIEDLRIAGLMHDIGKVAINGDALKSPGMLTDSEWIEVKKHSEAGYRILNSADDFSQCATFVLAHHERWDGKGYPRGLAGEKIPLESRIITLADAYDAMTCERPYRQRLPEAEILKEIKVKAGTQFDPELARIFIEQVLRKEWN